MESDSGEELASGGGELVIRALREDYSNSEEDADNSVENDSDEEMEVD